MFRAPIAVFRDMESLLEDRGAVLFSTLLQPEDLVPGWSYIGPRNGHISLFSGDALRRAWRAVGLKCAAFNANLHIALRGRPAFAERLVDAAKVVSGRARAASDASRSRASRGSC